MAEQVKRLKENALRVPDEDFIRSIKLERIDNVHGNGGPGTERVKVYYRLTFTDTDGRDMVVSRDSKVVATQLYYTNIDLWLDAGATFVPVSEVTGVET